MGPRDVLTHRSEEALWVEEAGHPEDVRFSVVTPVAELGVTFQELGVPKAESGRFPGDLNCLRWIICGW